MAFHWSSAGSSWSISAHQDLDDVVLLDALVHDLADLLGHVVDPGIEGLLLDGRVHLELAEDVRGQGARPRRSWSASMAAWKRVKRPRTRL